MEFSKKELAELAVLLKGTKYGVKFEKAANKKPISVSSRKAKGREFQKDVAGVIAKHLGIDVKDFYADEAPVAVRPMGQSGVDIIIRKPVKFYYSVEVKNQNALSIGSWWQQCKANTADSTSPLLVVKSKTLPEPLYITNEGGFFRDKKLQ